MEMQSCGKTFMNHSSLTRHKKCHIEDKPREPQKCPEKVYKCEECGKTFVSPSDLRTHERSYTGEKPYECYECGKVFPYQKSFWQHKRTHIGEKPYECKYTVWESLHAANNFSITHGTIHTGDLRYKYQKCEKALIYPSFLRLHERSHNGEKPYEGKQCGKTFKSPESIQIHERVQRERPMNVNSIVKPSVISVPFRHTKDCTQERHCI